MLIGSPVNRAGSIYGALQRDYRRHGTIEDIRKGAQQFDFNGRYFSIIYDTGGTGLQ